MLGLVWEARHEVQPCKENNLGPEILVKSRGAAGVLFDALWRWCEMQRQRGEFDGGGGGGRCGSRRNCMMQGQRSNEPSVGAANASTGANGNGNNGNSVANDNGNATSAQNPEMGAAAAAAGMQNNTLAQQWVWDPLDDMAWCWDFDDAGINGIGA
jgi:hypothetical protein